MGLIRLEDIGVGRQKSEDRSKKQWSFVLRASFGLRLSLMVIRFASFASRIALRSFSGEGSFMVISASRVIYGNSDVTTIMTTNDN
jgi:hypothetical protein